MTNCKQKLFFVNYLFYYYISDITSNEIDIASMCTNCLSQNKQHLHAKQKKTGNVSLKLINSIKLYYISISERTFQSIFLFGSFIDDVSPTPTDGCPFGTSPFEILPDLLEKGHPFVAIFPGSFVESLFSVTASWFPHGKGPQNLKTRG